MTTDEITPTPRSTTIALLGGLRLSGPLRLPRRLMHIALLGGMDLDFSSAEFAGPQVEIVKVSLLGGCDWWSLRTSALRSGASC
jgi:hypothetical protein